MKAKELILELQKLDPESLVIISGYEGGLDSVEEVTVMDIKLNVRESGIFGAHEVAADWAHDAEVATAIFIS